MDSNYPRFRGTARGIFGVSTWAPQRKPGQPAFAPVVSSEPLRSVSAAAFANDGPFVSGQLRQQVQDVGSFRMPNGASGDATGMTQSRPVTDNKAPGPPSAGQRLIAKYNYKANMASPLGEGAELTMQQMDKMTMIAPHPEQQYWWRVEHDDGRNGYVPANYVMPFEEKVTSLPWLTSRPVETALPANSMSYKPYKSAYAEKTATKSQYYCDVCEKEFNGPQPYSAHMASRAHREEVELKNNPY